MQKNRLKPLGLFLALTFAVSPFQNCGSAGTDTGNPNQPVNEQETGSRHLAVALCEKVTACHPSANATNCFDAVFENLNLPQKFGVSASTGWVRLSQSSTAEISGLLSYQIMDALNCSGDIQALSCASIEAQGAFIQANPAPYAGANAMVPTSGICPHVF